MLTLLDCRGIRTAMTEPLIKAVGEGIPRDVVAQGRWGK